MLSIRVIKEKGKERKKCGWTTAWKKTELIISVEEFCLEFDRVSRTISRYGAGETLIKKGMGMSFGERR